MILILMQLSFIVMGTFLDDTAMLVIVAPLYVPLVGANLGFDLIWYGVLYTITTQIAYMTPPFGYNLFLMRAMAPPEIRLQAISTARSFRLSMRDDVLALIIIMVFPDRSRFGCPDYVYNKLTRIEPGHRMGDPASMKLTNGEEIDMTTQTYSF